MNLFDIYKESMDFKENNSIFEDIIIKLEELNDKSYEYIEETSKFIIKSNLSGNSTEATNNIQTLRNKLNNYHDSLKMDLRSIDFTDSIVEIANLNIKYKYININDFTNKYLLMCKQINAFLRNTNNNSKIDLYAGTIRFINETIEIYRCLISVIDDNIRISSNLKVVGNENSLKIRLLKEDNSLEQLIDNMTTINNIYNIVNSLVGDKEEKLKFRRLESGTLLADLLGCSQTLAVVLPLLTFSYKIYSEQFSPKAKLEIELKELEIEDKKFELTSKEVKTRGEYIRLIKEIVPENQIDFSNPDIQEKLLNLEVNLKAFYSDNPCIDINDKEYGVSSLKNKIIPIRFLDIADSDKEE